MTFDELIKQVEDGGIEGVNASIDNQEAHVLGQSIIPICQMFGVGAQLTMFAFMVGELQAMMAQTQTEWEKANGVILSFDDRMRLFTTTARIVYQESYKFRQQEDVSKQRVN